MAATGVGTDRFLLDLGGRCSRPQGSFDWPDRRRSAPSPRTGSGWSRPVGGLLHGWPGTPARPRSTAPPTSRRGRTSSRRRWRATGRTAATGTTTTSSSTARTPSRCRSESWQIWNEPNLEKYFAPKPIGPGVRPAPRDLPRRDQEPGSEGPDRPRRNARLRRRQGVDVPGQPLRDTRDSRATSTPPPCTPTLRTSSELGSQIEKVRAAMTKNGDGRTPLWLTELGWGSAAARQVRAQQGAAGPGATADGRLQD